MDKLSGKYAVVTGGGRGIGEAIVKRFLDEGIAGIAILDYDSKLIERYTDKKTASAEKILAIQCDVSDGKEVEAAVSKIMTRFGKIDILINNAGITKDSIFHKMTDESWDAVLDVNLKGPYNTCKYIFPIMRKNSFGRIVNISSVSAFGNIGQANYAASKAGLIGFSKTLAKEGGRKNILVNCVAPGYIETDMYNNVPQEIIGEHLKNIPLNRLGHPKEVANVVAFLVSEDASFISGQCLIVNGGAST